MQVGKLLATILAGFIFVALSFKQLAAQEEINEVTQQDCVILLHGLARTSNSMNPMAKFLEGEGFRIANIDYPSRKKAVEQLAPEAIERGLNECADAKKIHFVTHSMGGILVRYYLNEHTLENLGRVVMLAPPNQGSEIVDNLKDTPGFEAINGPAGMQLGTQDSDLPKSLGPVGFELGVIAGTTTFNPLLSQYLPNPDDGKVSVENTKVEGMTAFISLPVSHPFVMRDKEVQGNVLQFINTGSFK